MAGSHRETRRGQRWDEAITVVLIYNGSWLWMNCTFNLRCTAPIIIVVASLSFFAQAQISPSGPQNRYLILSYFKSRPDRAAEHVRYERKQRKPIYEHHVKNARVAYWKLFAVQFPGGATGDYDFVTLVECAKSCDVDAMMDLNREEAIPDPKRGELGKDTIPSTIVRQDLVSILESTENWSAAETLYLHVRFMKPRDGKSAALASQERTVWKPYYEDAVRVGANTSWAFTALRFASELSPYTRVWFSGMAKFNDTDGNTPQELVEKWEPKFRALPPAVELRSVVRDELWRLLDQTPAASGIIGQ